MVACPLDAWAGRDLAATLIWEVQRCRSARIRILQCDRHRVSIHRHHPSRQRLVPSRASRCVMLCAICAARVPFWTPVVRSPRDPLPVSTVPDCKHVAVSSADTLEGGNRRPRRVSICTIILFNRFAFQTAIRSTAKDDRHAERKAAVPVQNCKLEPRETLNICQGPCGTQFAHTNGGDGLLHE